jgi:hypothetical protein
MYQVSWAVNHGDNNIEDFFLFMDTIQDAHEYVASLEGLDNLHHWTLSMVLEGSDPDHAEVYMEDPDERMEWRHNAIAIARQGTFDAEDNLVRGRQVMQAFALLPPRVRDEELFATVINLMSHYVEDPTKAARILSVCSESLHKVWASDKKAIH